MTADAVPAHVVLADSGKEMLPEAVFSFSDDTDDESMFILIS